MLQRFVSLRYLQKAINALKVPIFRNRQNENTLKNVEHEFIAFARELLLKSTIWATAYGAAH